MVKPVEKPQPHNKALLLLTCHPLQNISKKPELTIADTFAISTWRAELCAVVGSI